MLLFSFVQIVTTIIGSILPGSRKNHINQVGEIENPNLFVMQIFVQNTVVIHAMDSIILSYQAKTFSRAPESVFRARYYSFLI